MFLNLSRHTGQIVCSLMSCSCSCNFCMSFGDVLVVAVELFEVFSRPPLLCWLVVLRFVLMLMLAELLATTLLALFVLFTFALELFAVLFEIGGIPPQQV